MHDPRKPAAPPASGHGPEIVPDAIPYDAPEPTAKSKGEIRLPGDVKGQIGGLVGTISWRSRMRWLDDGGR